MLTIYDLNRCHPSSPTPTLLTVYHPPVPYNILCPPIRADTLCPNLTFSRNIPQQANPPNIPLLLPLSLPPNIPPSSLTLLPARLLWRFIRPRESFTLLSFASTNRRVKRLPNLMLSLQPPQLGLEMTGFKQGL